MRRHVPRSNIPRALFDVLPHYHASRSREVLQFAAQVDLRFMIEVEEATGVSTTPHLFVPSHQVSVSIQRPHGLPDPRSSQSERVGRAALLPDRRSWPEPTRLKGEPIGLPDQRSLIQQDELEGKPLGLPDRRSLRSERGGRAALLPDRETLLEYLQQLEADEEARSRQLKGYTWSELSGKEAELLSIAPVPHARWFRIPWDELIPLFRVLLLKAGLFSLAGLAMFLLIFVIVRGVFVAREEALALQQRWYEHAKSSVEELERGRVLLFSGEFEEAQAVFGAAKEKILPAARFGSLASLVPFAPRFEPYLLGAQIVRAVSDLGESAAILAHSLVSEISAQERARNFEEFEDALRLLPPLLARVTPEELSAELFSWSAPLQKAKRVLSEAPLWIGAAKNFAGFEGERSYLVLFQNSSELRPTGGFIGTYGLLRFSAGSVSEFWVDDVYNRDSQLRLEVVPPRALRGITETWGLRDANWFFDFPTSAQKATWFFEQAGGEPVDGVIAILPGFIERILAIIGPITIPGEFSVDGGDVTISHQNVIEILQREVYEARNRGASQPKAFVKEFGSQLFTHVTEKIKASPLEFWEVVRSSLRHKDILVWTHHEPMQARLAHQNWDGRVRSSPESDYLAIVISNVKGFKADYVTQNTFFYTLLRSEGGSLVGELTIHRLHTGKDAPYPWWRKPNRSWVRVFVPAGARLLAVEGDGLARPLSPLREAYDELLRNPELELVDRPQDVLLGSGAEILSESGRTVFAAWMEVEPGKTRALTFRYLLPSSIASSAHYRLLWQKQPGVEASYEVVLPSRERVSGELREDVTLEER